MTAIDLNADLGEGGAYDLELLGIVSSCNIACGGHAGDEASMAETVRAAIANEVSIGAHPSYPDREGFGRRSRYAHGDGLLASLCEQIEALRAVARYQDAKLTHIKPHGALNHDASVDRALAELIIGAIGKSSAEVALVGPAGSELQRAAEEHGMRFLAEAFVDRAYRADGTLVPRSEPRAVHSDINTITTQAVSLATEGSVTCQSGEVIKVAADTLCIHGDTDGAAEAARAVRDVLGANGVEIRAA